MKIGLSRIGALTALVLLIGSWALINHQRTKMAHAAHVRVEIGELPQTLGDWTAVDEQGLSLKSREVLKLDRYVKRSYRNSSGKQIFLYIGYWAKQSGGHQAAKHSPKLCLPANGWQIKEKRTTELTNPNGSEFTVNQVTAMIQNRESLFYYWFFTGERTYHQEWKALGYISQENLFHGRSDGGIVEITAPVAPGEKHEKALADADQTIEEFIAVFQPELEKIIASGRA